MENVTLSYANCYRDDSSRHRQPQKIDSRPTNFHNTSSRLSGGNCGDGGSVVTSRQAGKERQGLSVCLPVCLPTRIRTHRGTLKANNYEK